MRDVCKGISFFSKADLPGKPMTYKTTDEFLKMFGLNSLDDLPELPRYKLDSNRQIVVDDIEKQEENIEALMPSDTNETEEQ